MQTSDVKFTWARNRRYSRFSIFKQGLYDFYGLTFDKFDKGHVVSACDGKDTKIIAGNPSKEGYSGSTLAGQARKPSFAGGGGPARAAKFSFPSYVALAAGDQVIQQGASFLWKPE